MWPGVATRLSPRQRLSVAVGSLAKPEAPRSGCERPPDDSRARSGAQSFFPSEPTAAKLPWAESGDPPGHGPKEKTKPATHSRAPLWRGHRLSSAPNFLSVEIRSSDHGEPRHGMALRPAFQSSNAAEVAGEWENLSVRACGNFRCGIFPIPCGNLPPAPSSLNRNPSLMPHHYTATPPSGYAATLAA